MVEPQDGGYKPKPRKDIKVTPELSRLMDDVYLDVEFTQEKTLYPARLRPLSNRYSKRIKDFGFNSVTEFMSAHVGLRVDVLPRNNSIVVWTDSYYDKVGFKRGDMLLRFETFIRGKGDI